MSDERRTAEQVANQICDLHDLGTGEREDFAAALESYAAERVAEEREAHLEILVMVRDYCQINNWTEKKIYKPVCEAIAAIRKRGSR